MSGIMRRLGAMIRETGQALDRLGCRLQGSNAYLEDGRLFVLWWNAFMMLYRCACQPSDANNTSIVLLISGLGIASVALKCV